MNTIHTLPEFAQLTEEEILSAMAAYDALYAESDDDSASGPMAELETPEDLEAPEDPIVQEVVRLINAYADRFEEFCQVNEDKAAEALDYEPEIVIEQIAFDMFNDALHDTLQEEDE